MNQEKKSFFDFTSPFELKRPIEIFSKSLKDQFYILKNDKFKLKTLVLQRNYLIKFSSKKSNQKYYNITNALLELVNHTQLGTGISITKNGANFTFYGIVDHWYSYMKKWCIQPNFQKEYCMIKLVGKGSFAKVYKIQSLSDKKEFAVKLFDKTTFKTQDRPALLKEIELMRIMNNKNVVSILETYENEQYIFIVQELFNGGELHQELKKTRTFSEYGAFIIIQQVIEALQYIHSHGIIHRDIKPENIILREQGMIEQVVLADFGLADYFRKDCKYMFTRCGTPGFVAPELLQDKIYDYKVDIYSCGILFYYLLVGKGPFDSNNYDQTVMANFNGWVDLTKLQFSIECLELLRGMLDPNPIKRYSIDQIKQSQFFRKHQTVFQQYGSQSSLGSIPSQGDSRTTSPLQSPKQEAKSPNDYKSRFVNPYASPLQSPTRQNAPSFSPLQGPFGKTQNLQRIPIQI
ncbi:unnamed protein product [Paramecium pentaurelia]|uniref:Protein kinase domain-containing protein n=1 Tax=Paramecium pentaurelia TaxID=43138 RepID=A0A8S1UBX3_9CILI|nr:unnamed protein product [Paramecium pentaurelia]